MVATSRINNTGIITVFGMISSGTLPSATLSNLKIPSDLFQMGLGLQPPYPIWNHSTHLYVNICLHICKFTQDWFQILFKITPSICIITYAYEYVEITPYWFQMGFSLQPPFPIGNPCTYSYYHICLRVSKITLYWFQMGFSLQPPFPIGNPCIYSYYHISLRVCKIALEDWFQMGSQPSPALSHLKITPLISTITYAYAYVKLHSLICVSSCRLRLLTQACRLPSDWRRSPTQCCLSWRGRSRADTSGLSDL